MSLRDPSDIKVAIVGVGNCASSLVQGLAHYRDDGANAHIGLMHLAYAALDEFIGQGGV